MSYKAKADNLPADTYRGGAITEQAPKPRLRYPCFAANCPMPGTIFPDQLLGEKTNAGTCAWHYGVPAHDLPKVTAALREWACVAYEVREARRVLTGESCGDPAFVQSAFANAWERLRPLSGTWEAELQPGRIRSSKGEEQPHPENYGDWGKRLEAFIGARVVEVLSIRRERAAA